MGRFIQFVANRVGNRGLYCWHVGRHGPSNGFTLTVGGFTDKQPELLREALSNLQVEVDEQAFNQAVDRYVRALNNAQQQFPFTKRLMSTPT